LLTNSPHFRFTIGAPVERPTQAVKITTSTHSALERLVDHSADTLGKVVSALAWHAGRLTAEEWAAITNEWTAEVNLELAKNRGRTLHRYGRDGAKTTTALDAIPKPKVWEPEPKGKGKKA